MIDVRKAGTVSPMRIALFIFVLLSAPAFAEIGWSQYDNTRFGYSGGVPSGFSGYGEDDSRVGQIFDRPPTGQVLSYFGEALADGSFGDAVARGLGNLEQQGWNIAYQAVTPDWASITAQMGHRRVFLRMILLCDRQSIATMTMQYSAADAADIKVVTAELESAFKKLGC